jgi:diguanylate cyclase (GGDEF)-like protein/PAS domain S-box-containing protein
MTKITDLWKRLLRLYDKHLTVMAAATLFVVLSCVSLILLDGWRTWQERNKEMHESEIVASNLARSLAQHAEDVILIADTTLQEMVARLEEDGDHPEVRVRVHALLAERVKTLNWMHGLFVFDEKGRWITNSDSAAAPLRNNADREYFIYHRDHADRGPHIGMPVQNRSNGDWIVTVSRRVNHSDGSFAGVVLATISMEYFQKFYASFDVGRHGTILLMQDSGTILVRSPFDEAMMGKSLASAHLFTDYLSKSPAGTTLIKSSLDGMERLNGYRHLDHYPLVVDVALSKDDILEKWTTNAYWHIFGVGVLVVALGALGYRTLGQIGLRLQVEERLSESERRLRTITDNMPAFIAYVDRDQRYRFCNAFYVDEFHKPLDKLVGSSMVELFGAEAYASIAPYVAQALAGQKVTFERHAFERGQGCYSLYYYVPDVDQAGLVRGFYAMVLDITPRKKAELLLSSKEKLLRGLTDHLPALVSYIDRDEYFQFNNQPYEKWLGKPLSEITGKHVREACGDEAYFKYKRFFDMAIGGQKVDFAFATEREGGKRYFNAAYIPQFDEAGKVVGVCSMINDITDLKKVELKLIKLARVDALTGLANRVRFDENLRAAIARSRRVGMAMALVYLDIDHFKSINDTYGHQVGDEALCEFARRLSAAIRKTDSVARLSGDEFVIILEDMKTREEAEIVAGKVLQSMAADFILAGKPHKVTASMGIAILRDDDLEPQSLLRRADQALYRTKSEGRNGFRFAPEDGASNVGPV